MKTSFLKGDKLIERGKIPRGVYFVIRGQVIAVYDKDEAKQIKSQASGHSTNASSQKDDKYVASVHNYGSSVGKFTLIDKESRLTYKASTQTVTLYINRKVLEDILDNFPNEAELVKRKALEEFNDMMQEKNVVKSLMKMGRISPHPQKSLRLPKACSFKEIRSTMLSSWETKWQGARTIKIEVMPLLKGNLRSMVSQHSYAKAMKRVAGEIEG